jgi:hypothetical protein
MPRPRVLSKPRVVPIVFEEDLYEAAVKLAKERGMSFSQYVRTLIQRDLSESKVQLTSAQQDDPRDDVGELEAKLAEDPVLEAELKDLEQAVERLEGDALALEYRIDSFLSRNYDVRSFIRWDDIQALRDRWQRLKKWYYAVRRQAGPVRVRYVAQKLVRAKDAIDRCVEKYLQATRRVREV